MRIAVTGATGFIGRHVVEHLRARGDDVVPVGRPLEREALAAAFHGADAVIHLAGVVSTLHERDYVAVNVEGTRAVAEAAQARGAALVHISSLAAAGPASAGAPHGEDDKPHPLTAYGRSKLESERVLEAVRDLRWIALRPGIVYGPGDRAMLPLFRMGNRGMLPLVGAPTAAYTLIHVSDVVRAIASALDHADAREAIFVGHPRPATGRDIAGAVRSAVGRRAAMIPVPMPITRIAAFAGDLFGALRGRPMPINASRYAELAAEGFVCRVDRLRERLGVVAVVDVDEGFAETAQWYRRHGWL